MNIWAAKIHDLWSWVYCWEVCLVGGRYEGSDQEIASFFLSQEDACIWINVYCETASGEIWSITWRKRFFWVLKQASDKILDFDADVIDDNKNVSYRKQIARQQLRHKNWPGLGAWPLPTCVTLPNEVLLRSDGTSVITEIGRYNSVIGQMYRRTDGICKTIPRCACIACWRAMINRHHCMR